MKESDRLVNGRGLSLLGALTLKFMQSFPTLRLVFRIKTGLARRSQERKAVRAVVCSWDDGLGSGRKV